MSRAMRDSGIPWIGKIPEHWEVSKLKFYVTIDSGDAISNKQITKEGKYPVYGGGDIMGYYSYYNTTESKLIIGRVGARCGCITMPRQKCWASDNALVLKSTLSLRYTYHLLQAMDLNRLNTSNAQPLITSTKVKNVFIPLTPIEEQKAIADFLDEKCAEIDSLVAVQEQMLEELRAYKQSLITETVTHGLNPSAPMRDSGIPWIGKIPQEWEVELVSKYFYEVSNRNSALSEQNLLSLSYGNIVKKNIETTEGLLPASFDGYNIIEKNDIVFRFTDLQNDKKSLRTGIVKEDRGIITSAYTTIRRRDNSINATFFHYLFHSYDICKVFYGIGAGVRQSMNFNDLRKICIIYPSLAEQKAIADFLDKKCAEIDELIATKQQKIETLKEYKKSIIYEYVTGKKEVADE